MLIRRIAPSNLVWYESTLLSSLGLPHAFSTRLGGISAAPFDSLNLGNPSGCPLQDSLQNIDENYRLLKTAIGAPTRTLLRTHQVHGPAVAICQTPQPWDSACRADAIVLTRPDSLASVRVADCVPVLMASADGAAVAAVHAGWRGVIAGVVPMALKTLRDLRPGAAVVAAIGPCIGPDAFEVGPEVLAAFESAFAPPAPLHRNTNGKGYVDLKQAIARQLESAGLDPRQIDSTDRCTVRDAQEFFSHRRENGLTGRMAAMIGPA